MPTSDDHPAEERKAFKDWFDRSAARALAEQVGSAMPEFDRATFTRRATRKLETLEMIARVRQFSDALRETLPQDVPVALDILTRSLPSILPDCEAVTDGWLQWPVGQFIADHGVPHLTASMKAMTALTKRFTSEFALRPFVERHPDKVFPQLLKLTTNKDPHVRRWCSEGVRSRLPWGKKLHALVADPGPIWPILETLKDDPELYVRRSVANNLNDIAKDHPELVVERCKAWSKQSNPDRDWLIKHGLRSLIKDGNPAALAIIGYRPPVSLGVVLGIAPKKIALGEAVSMESAISNHSKRNQKLMIDYAVHYIRKSGKTSAKVFKWKSLELAAGETVTIEKRHAMKTTTTRALYSGTHRVDVQVNGVRLAEGMFVFAG